MTRNYEDVVVVRITDDVSRYLERLMDEGGFPNRAALVRSLLVEIMRDDEHAHGMSLS